MSPRRLSPLVFVSLLLCTTATLSAQTIRVPQDANLQQALNRVNDGGVIEIAAGTYVPGTNGFNLNLQGRSFTVRAAAGAQVILDGLGTNRILRMGGSPASVDDTVVFQDLRFENGFSDRQSLGGAVTVGRGEAVFRRCTFRNNRVSDTSSGGGAAFVIDASATFVDSLFEDNSAPNRGGAVVLTEAVGRVENSRFLRNQLNLPPHQPNAVGGGIFVLDSELVVERSHFKDNQAAFAGGAIYVFGNWQEPLSVPAAQATVTDSTFLSNRAVGDPCCAIASPTFGGAIHTEEHSTVRVRGSLFRRNQATSGGAIDLYRSILEVDDSVFQGNQAVPTDTFIGTAGSVFVSSADFNDASTEFGAVNRRPGSFTARNTLFQGRFEEVGTTAIQGGCIHAGGDGSRVFGNNGVEPQGTLQDNQAKVELDRVIFFDCDVTERPGSAGLGGAMFARIVDLDLRDSLVMDSDSPTTGGGIAALGFNNVDILRTTFANNSAGDQGGGAVLVGSDIAVRDSQFFGNEVSPGVQEGIIGSLGAGLFVGPVFGGQGDRQVTGVVSGSLFADNEGLAIHDAARDTGPPNLVRYDDNRFRETRFGTRVYRHAQGDPNGETVAGLNSLVIGGVDKSQVANRQLNVDPRAGQVVAAPAVLPAPGATGSGVGDRPVLLGFAWNGRNGDTARLAGQTLTDRTGLVPVTTAGTFPLQVAGIEVDRATVRACTTDTTLCLGNDRFEVTVDFTDFSGFSGSGRVVPLSTDDSGLFFFFDADNWEILVKVLNGCPINNRFWVFSAATTNVEYRLTVTDRVTGASTSYLNPLGTAASAITDTDALPVCNAGMLESGLPMPTATADDGTWIEDELASMRRVLTRNDPDAGNATGCVPDGTALCLNQDRFRVEVDFEDFTGFMGAGQVVPVSTDDSGLFFFFDEDNWEILVKVLNGCPINNRYWVFSAATTNVEYTLRVTDTDTGDTVEYRNPLGTAADAVTDTGAFMTCP